MRKVLTGEEFDEVLTSYSTSAFRLEQQPVYAVSWEADNVAAFLAGAPQTPTELPGLADWFASVNAQTSAGRPMTRVRVHDEPPTDYQRWIQWLSPWNVAAGEQMHYLNRSAAVAAGITRDLSDWWLIDGDRVILMDFDDSGHLVEAVLTDDPDRVAWAIRWRDTALAQVKPE